MTTATQEAQQHAEQQARAQLGSIVEMIEDLHHAENSDDPYMHIEGTDEARQRIYEDPLSVEVRSDWHRPGSDSEPAEFRILLCTGGPAVQIVGTLNQYDEPERARIEYQDWFTPWTELVDIERHEREALLAYCQCFYFGA